MATERRRRPRRRSHWDGVLGMNARNAMLAAANPADAVRLVNRKHGTKLVLTEAGIPVAPTIGVAETPQQLQGLIEILPDAWAMKPDRGRAGGGIVISLSKTDSRWTTPGGRLIDSGELFAHGRRILSGEYSMGGGESDLVLAEPLLVSDGELAALSSAGLPDVRVIVHHGRVLAAMLRLATAAGDGKANLHQGGIGVAVDPVTGRTGRAMHRGMVIGAHPDTGRAFDTRIPHWEQILDISERCSTATGLGYLGADIVIDRHRGPLVIEVNAHPGLEIQNVCAVPLGHLSQRRPVTV